MAQKEHTANRIVMLKIFLFILCLSPITSYSQSNNREAAFKNGDVALRKFLLVQLDKARKENDLNSCLISVTFAKFSIDKTGNVKGLTFSENPDTPPIFRNLLKRIILSSNGLWKPKRIKNKFVESKPFVLPFIYQMEAGCTVNNKTVTNGTDAALLNIISFDNTNTNQLDCILLKPIVVFSNN